MVCLYCFPKASCANLVASDVWNRKTKAETLSTSAEQLERKRFEDQTRNCRLVQIVCLIYLHMHAQHKNPIQIAAQTKEKMQDAAKFLPEKIYSALKNFLKKWHITGEQQKKNFDFTHTHREPKQAFYNILFSNVSKNTRV